MGADQQFCLRWNNFHTNITSAFESLRDDEDFVDITLACEGRQVKAHKMVLSACSPYFRSLLRGNPCQHPIVFLKDVTFANLSSILDFMYHGEVNVSHNELATFLKTAEALKVRGLAEDEKKKDTESCNESSSPPPPREPPDPGSPRPEESNTVDTHLSDSPPPAKRQRRRSGASVQSAEDTNETVLSDVRECTSVKNEPQDFNEDEDLISHSLETSDVIKTDLHSEDNCDERSFGPSDSVTISRSQAAMQQLQESFGSFIPGMGQSPGFLSHGASDMSRPPQFSMEGVQGLPPGISTLPGPSMSQGAASQDSSQGQDSSLAKSSTCIRSPTSPSASPSSTGNLSGPLTVAPPTMVSPTHSLSGSQVHIKQEFSPSEILQRGYCRDYSPDISSPYDEMKNLSQNMIKSSSFHTGFDRQAGSCSGGGSFSVSSSVGGSGGFSPNSSQVLSPQYSRQRTNTGDEVQCNLCGRTLCNKYVLKVHMRDMHSPRQNHQCPLCKRCYSSLNSLRVHLSTIHKTGGVHPQ